MESASQQNKELFQCHIICFEDLRAFPLFSWINVLCWDVPQKAIDAWVRVEQRLLQWLDQGDWGPPSKEIQLSTQLHKSSDSGSKCLILLRLEMLLWSCSNSGQPGSPCWPPKRPRWHCVIWRTVRSIILIHIRKRLNKHYLKVESFCPLGRAALQWSRHCKW